MNAERAASARSSAPPRAVWDVLLDGRRWSFWNPGVEWMWIEGEPAVGSPATIKLHRVRQTAFVIEEIVAPQRLVLRLTIGPIARLTMSWKLHADNGGTRIESDVATAGVAARFLLARPAGRVAAAMPASLERLAERAEHLVREPDAVAQADARVMAEIAAQNSRRAKQ